MSKTAAFPTADEAGQALTEAERTLADVRQRIARNEPGLAAQLGQAQSSVDAATLLLREAERVDVIRAEQANVANVEAEVAWLEGDEHRAHVDKVVAAYDTAVDAVEQLQEAWA